MKKSERLIALQILTTLKKNKVSLSIGLTAQDITPLIQKLCFGVCRSYYQLDTIASVMVKKKPKPIEVWLCLLMGIYQIHELQMPEYAVVKETVSLLEAIKKPWAKGLVNAVLRGFCRERDTILKKASNQKTYQHNHPNWLVTELTNHYPTHWQSILQANDQHPPMTLRVNLKQNTREQYLEKLEALDIGASITPFSKVGITLEQPVGVDKLPDFFNGAVSVQDEAAQLAVQLLDIKPNQRILDACCAPGGKTGHILELENHLKQCLAVDVDPKRLKKVEENLSRLKLSAEIVAGDVATPETWWDKVPFDRILLDAPCSAVGVIRRHPDIKLLRDPQEIKHIVQLQHQLLRSVWPLLARGGKLLYATCSIMPEENTQQIKSFLSETPDAQIDDKNLSFGISSDYGWQILPGSHNMDGFFYSLLIKK